VDARITRYLDERAGETGSIPGSRRARLEEVSEWVARRLARGETARLLFVCTHNARRSQMAQLWARAAAERCGLESVATFSGGTEATAVDPRAVEALRRAGFRIERPAGGENPRYRVRLGRDDRVVEMFSKRYDQHPGPGHEFCAVMTCAAADGACPAVPGADLRVALPYDDPGASDGTPEEGGAYDECSRRIAREMLHLFSCVGPRAGAGR
jgi:arsenate reductase